MKEVRLKDICKKGSSQLKQKDVEKLSGPYPVYGASGQIASMNSFHQDKDYIAIVKDGSGIGRVMFLPAKSSVIGTMQYILPKEGYDIRYIGYCLQSLGLSSYKQGAAIPHIYFRDYGERIVNVEEDIKKQQAIVSKLDTAFAKIDEIKDNAKRALDEAILLFDTALNATFSVNSGWEEHRLDELCSIESRLVDPTAECFARIPHIGGANITSTTGHLIDVKAVEDEDLSSGKYFFEENVVLYNKIRPYLKKVALPTSCGLCSADMYPLTPKKGTDREFLRFLLLTKHFTDYAISGSARAGMPKVNRKHLFAYSCYTPSLEKQKLIASNLRSLLANIEELQKNEDSILKECETLKQAVLKQVFEINN